MIVVNKIIIEGQVCVVLVKATIIMFAKIVIRNGHFSGKYRRNKKSQIPCVVFFTEYLVFNLIGH